jgi:hypothetical protein
MMKCSSDPNTVNQYKYSYKILTSLLDFQNYDDFNVSHVN